MLCLKIAVGVANSVDPDETPRSAASHLGLYCLHRHIFPITYGTNQLILKRMYIEQTVILEMLFYRKLG